MKKWTKKKGLNGTWCNMLGNEAKKAMFLTHLQRDLDIYLESELILTEASVSCAYLISGNPSLLPNHCHKSG